MGVCVEPAAAEPAVKPAAASAKPAVAEPAAAEPSAAAAAAKSCTLCIRSAQVGSEACVKCGRPVEPLAVRYTPVDEAKLDTPEFIGACERLTEYAHLANSAHVFPATVQPCTDATGRVSAPVLQADGSYAKENGTHKVLINWCQGKKLEGNLHDWGKSLIVDVTYASPLPDEGFPAMPADKYLQKLVELYQGARNVFLVVTVTKPEKMAYTLEVVVGRGFDIYEIINSSRST